MVPVDQVVRDDFLVVLIHSWFTSFRVPENKQAPGRAALKLVVVSIDSMFDYDSDSV
jgi:hypothetical protein